MTYKVVILDLGGDSVIASHEKKMIPWFFWYLVSHESISRKPQISCEMPVVPEAVYDGSFASL